jgi:cysteine desulfurase
MSNYRYFDYAAATPMDPRVLEAMQSYFSVQFYNPSALYLPAREVAKAITAARATVAGLLGARPTEVIFTAGGTEANNMAIHGVMRAHKGANVVVSAIEHDSVLAPSHQYDCREVIPDESGRLSVEQLREAIDDQTVLVSVQYANNEIGTVQPLRDIAELVQQIRNNRRENGNDLPLYFHTDACQVTPYFDLHVSRLGVDMMTLNGGKMYGPKQSGVLYVNSRVALEPLVQGGGQERNIRSGTENVPAIIGLAKALELVQADRKREAQRVEKLRDRFIRGVQVKVQGVAVTGSLKYRLPNNVHLTIAGQDNERLLVQLDEAGILAAAGSACSASSEEPSHVLRALGMSDAEAQSSLRFTLGHDTTEDDIDYVVDTLAKLVQPISH